MLVHQTSADGWAPLHLAAAFGGPQATALLLAHGAHVHRFSRNPMQNQPLHACIALSRNCETARILIAQGADVNMTQAGGYTPLHQAAAAGLEELTRILLEAGARPGDGFATQGKTPADYRTRNRASRHAVGATSFPDFLTCSLISTRTPRLRSDLYGQLSELDSCAHQSAPPKAISVAVNDPIED